MKNSILTFFLFLVLSTGYSQNLSFNYSGRYTPSVKQEDLNYVKFIGEITPDFRRQFRVPYNEQVLADQVLDQQSALILDRDRKMDFSQEFYTNFMDYVSVEILATSNGKALTALSNSYMFTTEQKNILNNIDPGTEISIKIKFKYKNLSIENLDRENKIIEGNYSVTVVPEMEAEYPGGFKQLSEFYTKNVIDKIQQTSNPGNIQRAIVNFTVNEDGKIMNAKIFRTSEDPAIDKLLLDASNNMPKWKPAENSKGVKVKQEISIPFGGRGC